MGDCDLASCDTVGAQLVHSAAMGGNGVILQKLLDLGAVETATTSMGRTCLHYAAHGEAASTTPQLMLLGCIGFKGPTKMHHTVLEICAARDLLSVRQCALPYGKGLDCTRREMRDFIVILHHTQQMLQWKRPVDTEGHVPGGHVELSEWLLNRGAQADQGDCAGITPLMLATEADCPQLVSLLLEHGADLHARSAAGCTPLHFATCSGVLHVVPASLPVHCWQI